MSEHGLRAAQGKMRAAGVSEVAIEVFSHYYRELESGAGGLILESSIEPLTDVATVDGIEVSEADAHDAFAKTVFIKLNGGLGTSMGLDRAKNLLPVRDGLTFLDIIVKQTLSARERYDVALPLLFMNSFRTRDDTLEVLAKYPDLAVEGLPVDFLQNQEPKLLADSLEPVEWPADPTLEWCPPGHGDLYTALEGSGVLDQLLAAGFRYATVSNGDNLGATPDPQIAGWFAQTGAPFAAELCVRTVNDKKGGHVAVRKEDGQLVLRETAQTSPDEMQYFTDEHLHRYFNTNNLWLDLQAVRDTLSAKHSVLGLAMIRNTKTVDPADASSPSVVQIETAMGAAIEVFPGATAICVGRDRFVPVKTTNELLLLRSDLYELDDLGHLVAQTEKAPEVSLGKPFKLVQDFERRIPEPPSLREAELLTVDGDVTFGRGVVVKGRVQIDADEPTTIADMTVLEG